MGESSIHLLANHILPDSGHHPMDLPPDNIGVETPSITAVEESTPKEGTPREAKKKHGMDACGSFRNHLTS